MSRELPYRPCVGVALVNRVGDAFIGLGKLKRCSVALVARSWQLPHGGIDDGEEPLEAAKRELWEETNVRSIELIAEMPGWLKYDLPEGARGTVERALSSGTDPEMVPVSQLCWRKEKSTCAAPAGEGDHDAEFDVTGVGSAYEPPAGPGRAVQAAGLMKRSLQLSRHSRAPPVWR